MLLVFILGYLLIGVIITAIWTRKMGTKFDDAVESGIRETILLNYDDKSKVEILTMIFSVVLWPVFFIPRKKK